MAVRQFSELLKEALAQSGLSQRRLSEAMGYRSDNVISQILHGRMRIDLERLDAYCQHLGLRGDQREEFRLAAMLEHCPAEVGGLVRRLQDEVQELQGRLATAYPETRVAEPGSRPRRRPGRT